LNTRLLESIFSKSGYKNVTSTNDSRQAKDLYAQIKPDLLVLDLNMPNLDGFGVMEQLRELDHDSYLPILVISHEEDQTVRFKALQSGAKDFLNKPYDRVEVILRIRNLIEVRMLHNEKVDQNKLLEDKVKERTQDLYNTQLDVIQRLARAVEYRDNETGMHTIRMSHYSACLAAEVGLSTEDCETLLMAAPLHDIGKIGIPDSILRKPGKLTPEEFAIMKTHATIGGQLLTGSTSKYLEMARVIALSHHEKWDGTGYPNGLAGDNIPLLGRICGLCDVFDALTTRRPYKDAWTTERTLEELRKGAGKHFDPHLVECFIKIIPQIEVIRARYVDPRVDGQE
jgi:putative two-component system response regulator